LIEDFQDTHKILAEFIRILKDGGTLVLVFPDQQKYAEHCRKLGEGSNPHHQIPEMGVDYMLDCLRKFKKITVRETMEIEPYNCIVVAEKASRRDEQDAYVKSKMKTYEKR
jgi:ubiquinone/menaquinone biosynthesis C-methylase UbiE